MRKSFTLGLLLPAVALGGCTMFGGGRGADTGETVVRRSGPLVIPSTFTLPPPSRAAAPAQGG